jgi:hypothetical protein
MIEKGQRRELPAFFALGFWPSTALFITRHAYLRGMSSRLDDDAIKGYTAHVFVHPNDRSGSFRLHIGLLGKHFHTSAAPTRQIKESPEFDQLSGTDQAARSDKERARLCQA